MFSEQDVPRRGVVGCVILVMAFTVTVTACSSPIASAPTTTLNPISTSPTTTDSHEASPLAGTYWELLSIGNADNLTRVSPGVKLTPRFNQSTYCGSDPQRGGFSGGAYKTEGDSLMLAPSTWA